MSVSSSLGARRFDKSGLLKAAARLDDAQTVGPAGLEPIKLEAQAEQPAP